MIDRSATTKHLEMSSAVFDGIRADDVDCTSAALYSRLTFSREMSVEIGLPALQEEMGSLLIQAKGE